MLPNIALFFMSRLGSACGVGLGIDEISEEISFLRRSKKACWLPSTKAASIAAPFTPGVADLRLGWLEGWWSALLDLLLHFDFVFFRVAIISASRLRSTKGGS